MAGTLQQRMRYGENPHQEAALYRDGSNRPGVATARQLQGKELSYNNLADADAAMELVAEFDRRPSPSSSMPIPAASPRAFRWARPMPGRWPATRSAPLAASSP